MRAYVSGWLHGRGGDERSGRQRVAQSTKQLPSGHENVVRVGARRLHLLRDSCRQSRERVARPAAVDRLVTAVKPAPMQTTPSENCSHNVAENQAHTPLTSICSIFLCCTISCKIYPQHAVQLVVRLVVQQVQNKSKI